MTLNRGCCFFSWFGGEDTTPIKDYVSAWVAAGATWIGGCCRVGPKDIADIRAAMIRLKLIR